MKVLVADRDVDQAQPRNWSEGAASVVNAQPVRFGLANVRRTEFDEDADYNRNHVLVQVKAFALGRWDRQMLVDLADSPYGPHRGLGVDFAAEVVAVGTEVSEFIPGERVVPCPDWPTHKGVGGLLGLPSGNGSREFARLPASSLLAYNDAMRDEEAALLSTPASVGFAMVRQAHLSKRKPVLVTGGVSRESMSIVAALRHAGWQIALHGARREDLSVRAGCTVDHFVGEVETDWIEARNLAREIGGFEAVFDARPRASEVESLISMLDLQGSYVTGSSEFQGVGNALPHLVVRDGTVRGVHLGARVDLVDALAWSEMSEWSPLVLSSYQAGGLQEFIDHSFSSDPYNHHVVFVY